MKNDLKIRKLTFDLNATRALLVLSMFLLIFALPVSYHEGYFPFSSKTAVQVEASDSTATNTQTEQGRVAGVSTTILHASIQDTTTIYTIVGGVFIIIALSTLLYFFYSTFLAR